MHISGNVASCHRKKDEFRARNPWLRELRKAHWSQRVNASRKNDDVPCWVELSNRVSRVRIGSAMRLRMARVVTRKSGIRYRRRNYNVCSTDEKHVGAVPRRDEQNSAFFHEHIDFLSLIILTFQIRSLLNRTTVFIQSAGNTDTLSPHDIGSDCYRKHIPST